MTKTIFKIALATMTLGAMTAGGVASAEKPVNARQLNQERRIDAGQRSGKLTGSEAARLDAEQRSIRQYEASLRRRHGGKLTEHDKALVHARQEQANRHILNQKHDAQRGRNKLKVKI